MPAGASSAIAAASSELVLNTNSAAIARSSNPDGYRRLGNQALFVTEDGNSWGELWRSNGTAAGTVAVRSGENLKYTLIGEQLNGHVLMHVRDQTDNHSLTKFQRNKRSHNSD